MKEYSEEIILAYLNKQLSEKEVADLEQAMAINGAFEKKVALMRDLTLGMETLALKQKMIKISANKESAFTPQVQPKNRQLNWLYIAAGLFFLVTATYFLFPSSESKKDFAKFMTPPIGLPTTMGNTDKEILMDGMIDYKLQAYQDALNKWNNLLENDTLQYYNAAANFALKNYSLATEQFEQVVSSSSFKSQANWYLGLISIEKKEFDKAKKYIMASEHRDKTEILKLLP